MLFILIVICFPPAVRSGNTDIREGQTQRKGISFVNILVGANESPTVCRLAFQCVGGGLP